jgi:hypothetical protein
MQLVCSYCRALTNVALKIKNSSFSLNDLILLQMITLMRNFLRTLKIYANFYLKK